MDHVTMNMGVASPCSVPELRRGQWLLTQVELGTVALGYWTLVYVSRLLMSIGFQRGTHNQPVRRKKSQVVGMAFLPPSPGGWPRGGWGGGEVEWGEDFPAEGSWAFEACWGDFVPGLSI